MYLPKRSHQLISSGSLCAGGLIQTTTNQETLFKLKNGCIYLKALPFYPEDTLHWFIGKIFKPEINMFSASLNSVDFNVWHRHFGHPSKDVLKKVFGHTKGFSENLNIPKHTPLCDGCLHGKMHADSFKESEKHATDICELIHSDLLELPVTSYNKEKYVCTFLDDFSSYAVITKLKHKSEALNTFKAFVALIETQSGRHVKSFRSNQGGKFLSNEFNEFL